MTNGVDRGGKLSGANSYDSFDVSSRGGGLFDKQAQFR